MLEVNVLQDNCFRFMRYDIFDFRIINIVHYTQKSTVQYFILIRI